MPEPLLEKLTCPYCGRAGKAQGAEPKGRRLFRVVDRETGNEMARIAADYIQQWTYGIKFFHRRFFGKDELVGVYEAGAKLLVVYEVEH